MAVDVRGPNREEMLFFVVIGFIAVVIIFSVGIMGVWNLAGLVSASGIGQPDAVLQNMIIAGVIAAVVLVVLVRHKHI